VVLCLVMDASVLSSGILSIKATVENVITIGVKLLF
jgi:hypothetical protein